MADGTGPNARDGAEKGVAENLVLQWENLRYVIKGKVILSDVSGRVDAGEMLASKYEATCIACLVLSTGQSKIENADDLLVMGPSGAGKSTVLDIIAKRVRAEGRVSDMRPCCEKCCFRVNVT